jgi:hypothetical protein
MTRTRPEEPHAPQEPRVKRPWSVQSLPELLDPHHSRMSQNSNSPPGMYSELKDTKRKDTKLCNKLCRYADSSYGRLQGDASLLLPCFASAGSVTPRKIGRQWPPTCEIEAWHDLAIFMGILMVYLSDYGNPLVIIAIAIAMVQGCPIHNGSWMVWLSHVSIKSLEALPGGRSHSAEPRLEVTDLHITFFESNLNAFYVHSMCILCRNSM